MSRFGYDVTSFQNKVYAQVRTHLSRREVDRRVSDSHSLFEAQEMPWLKFDDKTVRDIVKNWETGDSSHRIWSSSAPHALQEFWRMRRF